MYLFKPVRFKQITAVITTVLLFLFNTVAWGQLPTNVPSPEAEPVYFLDTWTNIILYLVIPTIIIILFFVWRNRNKKIAEKKREQEKGE